LRRREYEKAREKREIGQITTKKPIPNFDTRNVIKEVELAKGIKVKDSKEFFLQAWNLEL